MKKKALVVDDSLLIRRVLGDLLRKLDLEIVEAGTAKEAVEMYQKHKPAVVTLDIVMPGENGIWALQKIMSMDPNAKVVMVSALSEKQLIIDSLRLGAKDFIVKPVDPNATQDLIRGLLTQGTEARAHA